jgi:hypothetical protein
MGRHARELDPVWAIGAQLTIALDPLEIFDLCQHTVLLVWGQLMASAESEIPYDGARRMTFAEYAAPQELQLQQSGPEIG